MKNIMIDIKKGIKEVFIGKASEENLFNLNGRVPLRKALLFGIQHILAMFVANITPLIIVFGAIGLFDSNISANAMLGSLFMAGFGTIIQLLIGARLPIVIGTSFTFVGVFITIGLSAGGKENAYYTILGSIIAGALITTICCFFIRWWGKLIKPIVSSVVIIAIGLSLLKTGATQFLGGSEVLKGLIDNTNNVPYCWYLVIALITFVAAILWNLFAKGSLKHLNVIFGITVGYLTCLLIPGMIDFSNLRIHSFNDLIAFPHIIKVKNLIFKPIPIILTTLCFLLSVVEGIGDTNALCKTCLNREPSNREITGVLVTDGINSCLCGLLGTLPLTTFAQNVGIVTQTKITNRFTVFTGACFLIIISLFPFLAKFLLTIPDAVLGGTLIMIFGSILVVGMKMASEAGFTEKNTIILAVAVCLGFGITLVDDFFKYLNSINLNYLSDLLSNNILNMFIIALILSWIIPDQKEELV